MKRPLLLLSLLYISCAGPPALTYSQAETFIRNFDGVQYYILRDIPATFSVAASTLPRWEPIHILEFPTAWPGVIITRDSTGARYPVRFRFTTLGDVSSYMPEIQYWFTKKHPEEYLREYQTQFGEEMGRAVWKGSLTFDMTREMVEVLKGKPQRLFRQVSKLGVWESWYYRVLVVHFQDGTVVGYDDYSGDTQPRDIPLPQPKDLSPEDYRRRFVPETDT